MNAAQHRVQPTWGTRRVISAFFWLRAFSVSTASPRSHPKRLTPAVGRSEQKCIMLVCRSWRLAPVITHFKRIRASSASWRNHSFLACPQSNCGASHLLPLVSVMKYDVISGRFGSGVATAFESKVRSPACQVNRRRPTPRAADLGYAPRYLGICLALAFSPFRRRVHAPTPSG